MFKVLHLCDRRQDNHKMPLGFVSHLNRDFPPFSRYLIFLHFQLNSLVFRRVKCAVGPRMESKKVLPTKISLVFRTQLLIRSPWFQAPNEKRVSVIKNQTISTIISYLFIHKRGQSNIYQIADEFCEKLISV